MAKFSTKPQLPVLNLKHPLVKGLLFDAPFFERGGSITRELRYRTTGALTNSPTWKIGSAGLAIDFGGATQALTYTTTSQQALTSFVSFEFLLFTRTNTGRIFDKRGAAFRYAIQYDGAAANDLKFFAGFSGTNGTWDTPAASFPLNQINHVAIVYDHTSTASVPIIYINNIKQSVTTTTPPVGTGNTDGTNLHVGNNSTPNSNMDGYLYYMRYWNRLLSRSEVNKLYNNPWCIYRKSLVKSLVG